MLEKRNLRLACSCGMSAASARSRLLPFAALITALLAAGWCAPATAHASCGDHVTIMPGHGPHFVREMASLRAMISDASHSEGQPRSLAGSMLLGSRASAETTPRSAPCGRCPFSPAGPERVPCRGPWCSGGPSPMNSPPTTAEGPCEQKALSGSALQPGHGVAMRLAFGQDQGWPVHHVFPIYHPPRIA